MVGAADLEKSRQFYDAVLGTLGIGLGVAHGGTPCEDPPGLRGTPGAQMYIAYLRDPDGNKICALHRVPR